MNYDGTVKGSSQALARMMERRNKPEYQFKPGEREAEYKAGAKMMKKHGIQSKSHSINGKEVKSIRKALTNAMKD